MTQKTKIHIIRHGQSESNVDHTVHHRIADHLIPLTQEGHRQTLESGVRLKNLIEENNQEFGKSLKIYNSPYLRTRQSMRNILEAFMNDVDKKYSFDFEENILLREVEYGMFNGVVEEEWPERFPEEFRTHQNLINNGGEFWARKPGGEAHSDVLLRAKLWFNGISEGTFKRHDTIIIVSHSIFMQAFHMMITNHDFEKFGQIIKPNNACINSYTRDENGDVEFNGTDFYGFKL